MPHIDLTTKVGNALELDNPFWIASSHYSENEAILKKWREYEPAAITLKTCTKICRTGGNSVTRVKTQSSLPRYGRAFYTDGPKSKELKSYAEEKELLEAAQRYLKNTTVGISVLATDEEDFENLQTQCERAQFCELNLK